MWLKKDGSIRPSTTKVWMKQQSKTNTPSLSSTQCLDLSTKLPSWKCLSVGAHTRRKLVDDPLGHLEYQVMTFGPTNSPLVFQALVNDGSPWQLVCVHLFRSNSHLLPESGGIMFSHGLTIRLSPICVLSSGWTPARFAGVCFLLMSLWSLCLSVICSLTFMGGKNWGAHKVFRKVRRHAGVSFIHVKHLSQGTLQSI